ncbi:hypothetical protein B0H10DRAFT_2082196 [Mycena sp. CBHHK59/15]|nr:hypothetical protein B0H10DRAFT_2109576 [Mycena sp. CBHHK59/15]KAJ6601577.1 hypothetical protein B0H10DRAFT_2082196 [Mycena sp. CBHHK59/15]
MSLRPLADSAHIPSLQYVDGSLRSQWAQLLEGGKFRSALAEQVDDIVVLGLFSRITEKPPSRRFLPSLFSGRENPIDLETIREFRAITDLKQAQMLIPNQTYDQLLQATDSLGKELWVWGKNKLRLQGDYYGRAALFWALRAYICLIAPWPPVHLKVVQIGQTREVGFGVVASRVLYPGEYIYECIGLLTTDEATDTTELSTITCPHHHTRHVFWGPIRMLNHDCTPNIQYVEIEDTRAMVAQTLCSIQPGQELFVDYGTDFWAGHCPCNTYERLHHWSAPTMGALPSPFELRPTTSTLQPTPSTSIQDDSEQRQIERRGKETARRRLRRFKDIGKKKGKQSDE